MNATNIDRVGTFGRLSSMKIFILETSRFLSVPLLELIYNHVPGLGWELAKRNRQLAHRFAKELISDKTAEAAAGKGQHDVMSILGKCSRYPVQLSARYS